MALTDRLRIIREHALDLLFPPQCAGCGAPGHEFCDRCAQKVEPVGEAICAHCGRPQPHAVALCADCVGRQASLVFSRAAALHTAPLREAQFVESLDRGEKILQPTTPLKAPGQILLPNLRWPCSLRHGRSCLS